MRNWSEARTSWPEKLSRPTSPAIESRRWRALVAVELRVAPEELEAEGREIGILVDLDAVVAARDLPARMVLAREEPFVRTEVRSEEHTSELQSRFGISYAV